MVKWVMALAGLLLLRAAVVRAAIVVPSSNLGNIWCVGDSITWGDAWTGGIGTGTDTPIPGGYRSEFFRRLNTAGYTAAAVGTQNTNADGYLTTTGQTANSGIPGIGLGALTRLMVSNDNGAYGENAGNWLNGPSAVKPNITLLMGGVNDLNTGVSPGYDSTDVLPPLLDEIFDADPHTRLYLSQLIPDPSNPNTEASIAVFNSYLPGVVADFQQQGYSIKLVPTFNLFLNADGTINPAMYFDGLHPSQAGYNALGDLYATTIESSSTTLPEPGLISVPMLASLMVRRWRKCCRAVESA